MNAIHKRLGDMAHTMKAIAYGKVDKAAMNENSGSAGGYLVPQEVVVRINEALSEYALFHMLAYRQPMKSRQCNVAGIDMAATHAAGVSPLLSGMTLSWTQEGQASPETAPVFFDAELVTCNLQGVVYASNQLVDDAGEPLGAYLERLFTRAIEWYVELACFNGTGVGQPTGIVGSPSTVPVNRMVSGHVSLPDVGGMVAALIPACFGQAVWACHPTALADIVTFPTYTSWSQPGTSLCGVLQGRPLYCTEKLPVLGTRGDLMLFDPTMYALGTRDIEIAVAKEDPTAFKRNQTAFRLLWRGDGEPLARGTSVLEDGSTVAGCFVALN